MPKKKGFYATEPAVPDKKISGTNPIGMVILGAMKSPTVPQRHEGTSHAFGPQLREERPPHATHGFGHLPKQRQGHYRTSGNPLAHQIGKK